ncbi:hypothetical protein [Streptomyces sp. NPDC046909]|uniref:hypothetical protein n=1 Tax=Streptomyces sp. NPDC046909 TaxID=3155617 RepID=UPI0033EF6E7D
MSKANDANDTNSEEKIMSFHKVAPVAKKTRKAAPAPKKAQVKKVQKKVAQQRRPVSHKG